MRLIITGASGFIGREIVPLLSMPKKNLLLVGRDKNHLIELFPGYSISTYDKLAQDAKGYSAVVHLAAMVRDNGEEYSAFEQANIHLLQKVLKATKAAGVPVFFNIQTLGSYKNNYTKSKLKVEEILNSFQKLHVVSLKLPAVHGKKYDGKMRFLNSVPKFLRGLLFQIISSLRPTVHAQLIANAIEDHFDTKHDVSIMLSDRQEGNWFYAFVKRILDLGFALFVTVFLWWVLATAWLAVKLSSKGPGIYAQQRVGKDGKIFTLYKFRTMRIGTKQVGTHEVTPDSITKIGRFLRKTKIDELPQIWNIFRNELSLVGPRPCLPVQKELIAQRNNHGVLGVKGGITGLAQIQGVDMSDPDRLSRLDAKYLDLRSIIMDFKIIVATMLGRGQGDKVQS